MGKKTLVLLTLLVLGVFLLPAVPVAASSPPSDDGVVIWNEDYVLAAGEELDGDLIVFNGDATLESESRIRGNAVIWNGNAEVDGIIEGNLVATNGDVRLGRDALVEGDVVCSWNCDVEQDTGARIGGEIVEGPSLRGGPFADWGERGLRIQVPPPDRQPLWMSGVEQLLRWIFRIVRGILTVLVIAAIGGVVALIWPEATDRVGLTVFRSPGASLGIGVLTLVAAITLVTVLAITICLSPAAVLIALALGAASLFGWVAIGARVGRRLLRALNAGEVAPLWVASLGTLVITLITMGLSAAFCLAPLGWLLMFVIGCFGLGAVVLTRFGTTPYVPGGGRQTPEPSPPSPPTGEIPDTPSSETAAGSSPLSPPATPPSNQSAQEGSPVAMPSEATAQVVVAAKECLARELDISIELMQITAIEPVEWSDASLGCPEPGKMYAQVITPGYRVLLEVEDEQFEVHTDREGQTAVICEPDR